MEQQVTAAQLDRILATLAEMPEFQDEVSRMMMLLAASGTAERILGKNLAEYAVLRPMLAMYGAWRAWFTRDQHVWPIVALLLFVSHLVRRLPPE